MFNLHENNAPLTEFNKKLWLAVVDTVISALRITEIIFPKGYNCEKTSFQLRTGSGKGLN